MTALVCDVCGGKLMGRPGGVFECEFCGVTYDTAWAKAKVQEIQGTVKVEGTVEVAGTVKIDGPVQVEGGGASAVALVKRGFLLLQDRKWDEAKALFEQALGIREENFDAYLGLCMVELKCRIKGDFESHLIDFGKPAGSTYARMEQLAEGEQKKWLDTLEEIRAAAEAKAQAEVEAARMILPPIRKRLAPAQNLVAAGGMHTVGVKSDGTVVATEFKGDYDYYDYGQCEVSDWRDIVSVAAGFAYSVGLKSDGTVVAVGSNRHGECNVSSWRDIVAVAVSSGDHTVGVKSDGTVVAVGINREGQCEVSDWRDIVSVAPGNDCTVGLKLDGTVVAVGDNSDGRCEVSDWRDIVSVAAREDHTVGLKLDGTVVAVGRNNKGQCEVSDWRDIVSVAAGSEHTVGLKSDGTVVAVGDNDDGQCDVSGWTDIVAVAAGSEHTVGLKSDGTVVATEYKGEDYEGRCEVSGWKLFNSIDTLEHELAEARRRAEAKAEEARRRAEAKAEEARRIAEERASRRAAGLCQHCGGELKGVFGKKCVACGEPKDYWSFP